MSQLYIEEWFSVDHGRISHISQPKENGNREVLPIVKCCVGNIVVMGLNI